ncbi:MAG TPA: FAD-dependent oxidoreductase, partial [bacterium]|nr:FAD-dependent oxidoreductase [bacterium]
MGYTELEIKLPTDFSDHQLKKAVSKNINSADISFSILRKSLDARNKKDIHWLLRVGVQSPAIKGERPEIKKLELPSSDHGKGKKVVITGCGPAGIFCGLILQRSGYYVTIIEKGTDIPKRTDDINKFEKSGILNKNSGYCFGEGGAGTFSDGKLTSRTKTITLEKNFIFEELIKAGAPDEIAYMTHPHLGSDNLKKIIPAIISDFRSSGGTVLFETELTDIYKTNEKITAVEVSGKHSGKIDGDIFVFAPGHSSFNLYRLLLKNNVELSTKPFAIGFRVEHLTETINLAQWGKRSLPGVKAAEYRLAESFDNSSVFSFCMCPGGKVVQSSPENGLSVVNGMSNYSRSGIFSNSAVVTPFKIEELSNAPVSPLTALDLLEDLEKKFYNSTDSFDVPATNITDLINGKTTNRFSSSSYSFNIVSRDFNEL